MNTALNFCFTFPWGGNPCADVNEVVCAKALCEVKYKGKVKSYDTILKDGIFS